MVAETIVGGVDDVGDEVIAIVGLRMCELGGLPPAGHQRRGDVANGTDRSGGNVFSGEAMAGRRGGAIDESATIGKVSARQTASVALEPKWVG